MSGVADRLAGGRGDDLFDHSCLGIGVVLHVLPLPLGELALGPFVQLSIGLVGAKAVAEQ
jgi:hypothetical protein